MKKDVKLKKTIFDTLVFSLIFVLMSAIMLIFKVTLLTNETLFVYVYVENNIIDKLSLDIDFEKTYYESEYPTFKGDIVLEIKIVKVQVEKETSPLNLCSLNGYTNEIGNPVVCFPNSFYFVIMGASYASFES